MWEKQKLIVLACINYKKNIYDIQGFIIHIWF